MVLFVWRQVTSDPETYRDSFDVIVMQVFYDAKRADERALRDLKQLQYYDPECLFHDISHQVRLLFVT